MRQRDSGDPTTGARSSERPRRSGIATIELHVLHVIVTYLSPVLLVQFAQSLEFLLNTAYRLLTDSQLGSSLAHYSPR